MSDRYKITKQKYMSDGEMNALQSTLDLKRSDDLRNVLILEMLIRTGGRAQEVLNIEKRDLNFTDNTVFLRGMKGSNDRELPLSPDFMFQLKLFTAHMADHTRIFSISYKRLFQVWQMYKPCQKKLHSTRHTYAIRQYKKNKDIRLLQYALGHRNIQNTEEYLNYLHTQEELQKLMVG